MEVDRGDVALVVDAQGLNCPLPVIKAKRGIDSIGLGERLRVYCTDPGSVADFAAWTRTTGHRLVDHSETQGVYIFVIERCH